MEAEPAPTDSVATVVAGRRLLMRRDFCELAALFATFYFLQGICEPTEGMLSQPLMSLYKRWGFDTEQIGRFSFILGLPLVVPHFFRMGLVEWRRWGMMATRRISVGGGSKSKE